MSEIYERGAFRNIMTAVDDCHDQFGLNTY